MKRCAKVLTVLLTLALPVAALGADAGKAANPSEKASSAVKASDKASNKPSQTEPAAGTSEKRPPLVGKVVETMNSGGYTYIYLEKKDGVQRWVAVPTMDVKVGDELELMPGIEMGKFTSRTMKRTFETIVFSGGPIEKKVPMNDEVIKKKAHEGVVTDTKKGNDPVSPVIEDIKVEKASGPNAYTIGEIYQKRGELAEKEVIVRAKVVKVSAGIMDKNWIHLRDGSGDAQKGTYNLVVTSQDIPAVGDVVTVRGTLYKDKDFGGGYKYEVILENASIKP